MKRYIKDGRFYNGSSIIAEGNLLILNPSEEILMANGYTEYVAPEPTAQELLEQAKQNKLMQIRDYDSSSSINNFTVNESINTWLTPSERANYKNSVEAAKLLGETTVSLYLGNTPVELPVQTAEIALATILLYADKCFMVTKAHELEVLNLDNIEDINNYDITKDYPSCPNFNILEEG